MADRPTAIPASELPKSGRHAMEASVRGRALKEAFIIFSLDDQRPACETDDWFYVSDTKFPNDGTPVTVQVGSSAKDVHIVYSIISGDKVIESGAVDRSNQLINRKFTYQPEYGNGLLLTFAWVKQGKVYTHQTQIMRPLPDKRLKLAWQTFRDRLTPGQQEEWRLTIKKPSTKAGGGAPADAQLMATLYDKSLEQLQRHQWSLSPYVNLPIPHTRWYYGRADRLRLSGRKYLTADVPLRLRPSMAVTSTIRCVSSQRLDKLVTRVRGLHGRLPEMVEEGQVKAV